MKQLPLRYVEVGHHSVSTTGTGISLYRHWSTSARHEPEEHSTDAVLQETIARLPVDAERVVAEVFSRDRTYEDGGSGDVKYARLSAEFRTADSGLTKIGVSYTTPALSGRAVDDLMLEYAATASTDRAPTRWTQVVPGNAVIALSQKAAAAFVHEAFGHGLEVDASGTCPLEAAAPLPGGISVSDSRNRPQSWGSATRDDSGSDLTGELADHVQGGVVVSPISKDGPYLHHTAAGMPLVSRFRSIAVSAESGDFMSSLDAPVVDLDQVSTARFNRTTRRIRLFASSPATVHWPSGASCRLFIKSITLDIDRMNDWYLGVHGTPRQTDMLCDKQGQRVPVSVFTPDIYVRSAGVTIELGP